ncbi:MAG: MgtC/SapB family protein [Clostridia bacterium]|nr:MgtC/SapB family protein [Clostridia bacterium]
MNFIINLKNYLEDINILSIFVRMFLAIICGGIIGLEREDKNRPAGLRTHVLVCVGSALVMITSQYMFNVFGESDVSRMGAQVISGIGFLGAGTIIINRGHVRGLTTAAGLWAVSCVGLAIGIGFYEGAIIGTLFISLSMVLLRRFSHKFQDASKSMDIYVEIDKTKSINDIMNILDSKGIDVTYLKYCDKPQYNETAKGFMISMSMSKRQSHTELIYEIEKMNGVYYIEQI